MSFILVNFVNILQSITEQCIQNYNHFYYSSEHKKHDIQDKNSNSLTN